MSFDGKVVIVTGSGSGIGRAVARLFAQEGATVVIADANAEAGKSAAAEIGGKALPFRPTSAIPHGFRTSSIK